MANLTETPTYDAGVYQIETSDPVLGGPDGTTNVPLKNLANRTAYLKKHVDDLESGATLPPGTATQSYVQAELNKLSWKRPARAATAASITLSNTQTIDGVALQVGDRVLVKNQATESQNGIYVVSATAWTRATDADENTELVPGTVVEVSEGTTNGNTAWRLTTDAPITVGTTALAFALASADLSVYAPLASPALTGTPTAPSAAADTETTQLATTAFVLGQASSAAPAMDGVAAAGTSKRFARGDHVHPTDTTRAPLASPTFTGTPAAPTAAADTNTTQLATTAFVIGQAGSVAPAMNGTAAAGTSAKFARADHVHPSDTSRAPLDSPALTGTPTAPTAAAGTSTTQIATTAFAMRAAGNLVDAVIQNAASITLTASDAGKLHILNEDLLLQTASLPSLASVPRGAVFSFKRKATATTSVGAVAPSGSDVIWTGTSDVTSGSANLLLKAGETLTVVAGTNSWVVLSGSAARRFEREFANLLIGSGWQKLPGGLIVQWGSVANSATAGAATAVSFPISFPSLALHLYQTASSAATGVQAAWFDTLTTSGFNSRANVANVNSRYLAIGY